MSSNNPATAETAPSPAADDAQLLFEREYMRQQHRYEDLRYKLSATLLVACPALALLPPRKLDWYTFGLGSAWLYCLSEVSNAHGRNMLYGFQRNEDIAKKPQQKPGVEGVKIGGWRGEKIVKDMRERDEEAPSIGSLIMEQIWDVWEQRDSDKVDKKKGPEVDVREEMLKRIREKNARDPDEK